jgi:hypothetical protein
LCFNARCYAFDMENNTNAPVNPVSEQIPVHSNKGNFWKGFAVGIITTIVVGVLGSFIFTYALMRTTVGPALNEARMKGTAAAVKSNLSILRAQAEVYYDGNDNIYSGVCRSPEFISIFTGMSNMVVDEDLVCYDNATTYVVAATFQDTDGIKTFCVNSAGAAATLPGKASEVVTSTGFGCK